MNKVVGQVWPSTFAKAKFKSPLLILDEAHHLKNPATRLASLFVNDESGDDIRTIAGTLDGAFERMLFLTATPFQLGHHELLNVIDRFRGIAWKEFSLEGKNAFLLEIEKLGKTLDQAKTQSRELDRCWQSLRQDDLAGADGINRSAEQWWQDVTSEPTTKSERVQTVHRAFERACQGMKSAEIPLGKWVIRHLRDRKLPNADIERRLRHAGGAIAGEADGEEGLSVRGEALLPFLLAARAQAVVVRAGEKAGRATFAEGLASSYEAFLYTGGDGLDEEEHGTTTKSERVNSYVKRLALELPSKAAYARHPKIAPLITT